MPEPGVNEYVSTRDGATRKVAVPGSAFDRRLARSRRWKLVGAPVELVEQVIDEPVDEPIEDRRAAIAERRAQRVAERAANDVTGLVETGD